MKYYTKLKLYKASNVYFNPEICQAYSYAWWKFVDKIKGKVIFNSYRYSNSTCKHQRKVRSVLRELGIKIDIEIEAPRGLQDLDLALKHTLSLIKEIEVKLENTRIRPNTRQRLNQELPQLRKQLQFICSALGTDLAQIEVKQMLSA